MPLPLAQGSKQVSSKSYPEQVSPLEEDDIDGTPLKAIFLQRQTAIATSDVLNATFQINLFHMKRSDNDKLIKSKACINIQVSPTAEPFSPRYRDSMYQVDLDPIGGDCNDGDGSTHNNNNPSLAPPVAIFCRKFLVCLVASQVIVFQLRKPLSQPAHAVPPTPSYITTPSMRDESMVIPVATNPRCVPSLTDILCLCTMETMENTLLLAGSQSGTIAVLSCKDASVAGILVQGIFAVSHLAHVSMGKRGRLVAIDDEGRISFFESHALIGTEEETQVFAEDEKDEADSFFPDESVQFDRRRISKRASEILRLHSKHENMVLVHLTPLMHEYGDDGQRFVTATWMDSHFLALLCHPSSSKQEIVHVVGVSSNGVRLVTQLTMTVGKLLETSHSSFMTMATTTEPCYRLEYHPKSSCLLVSTQLIKSSTTVVPFSCCWHWRSNTTSLLLASSISREASGHLSCFVLGTNLFGVTQFVHFTLHAETKLVKSLYAASMLSPNNTTKTVTAVVKEERPLLLGESSVNFPVSTKTSALHQSELDWRSASIPASYLSCCGGAPPQIGCIAPQASLVCIASLLGFCILNPAHKWRRFDRPQEVAFTVLAMEFWEEKDDAVLLTVIETSDKRRYLACWSHKRLDLSYQLLREVEGTNHLRWGIPLPADFYPNTMSVLSDQQGKAVVMISDHGIDPSVVLFQLQTSQDVVKCSVALHGGLNPDSKNTFLASASFDFDLEDADRAIPSDHHVAVIGMIGPDKVTAAVASKRSLSAEKDVAMGTLSKLILSDVFDGSFTWTMEFSEGSVWCWSTPESAISTGETKTKDLMPPEFVWSDGDSAHQFGTISHVGDSAMWMLGSKETQSQFAVGCLPFSKFGCIMRVGQDSTNHHRVIPGDSSETLEHEVFSLGRTSLTTPAFLVSLINHLLIGEPSPSDSAARVLHFEQYLKPREFGDTAFVAMRLLVLRTVEIVTSLKKKKEAFLFARAFFSRAIQLLADALSPNDFASFLLSLARQVEPSCMEHLFPLPHNTNSFETIEDLYIEVVRGGYLATPSASLPLLSTKLSALEECKDILYHCLVKLSASFLDTERDFDTTREERRFVRDLFRFANQLEQMDDAEFWSDSKLDVATMPTVEERKQGMVLASPTMTPKKSTKSSAFGIFMPLICSGRRRREERAVYEAASTFIGSGFEEFEYAQLDASVSERPGPVSVMYITGKLLVRLGLEEKHGWKRAAVIARLVLGDTVIDESGKGVVSWVQRMALTKLAVTAHHLSKSKEYLDLTDSDELTDVVTNYLVQGMFAANHEMTRSDAAWLLELVILSLSRLSPSDSVNQNLAPGLVLMATIVGHVSGRMEDMMRDLKKKDRNPLMACYEEAKKCLSSI